MINNLEESFKKIFGDNYQSDEKFKKIFGDLPNKSKGSLFNKHSIEDLSENEISKTHYRPVIDTWQSNEFIRFVIELPYSKMDDIKLELETPNVLLIKVTDKKQIKFDGFELKQNEIKQKVFTRSLIFNKNVNLKTIKTKFENGLLIIDIPRFEKSENFEIPIN